MNFTNYKWNKPIFLQAARYRCVKCFHSCEVYSNFEWVEGFIDTCHKCGTEQVETFYIPVFLYRWDCYPKLSIDPASLPEENTGCKECPHVKAVGGKYHWTELGLPCWECDSGGMVFEKYIDGEKMEEFIEIAIEQSKLKVPDMTYTRVENGHEYYYGTSHSIAEPDKTQIVHIVNWEIDFSST